MWCGFRVVWFQALLAISIGSVDFVQNARANSDTVNGYSRVTVTVRGTTQQIGVLSYRPEGKGPFPIVLYSHGRGTREQRLALENPVPLDHVRYWIKKGFAVVAPIRIGYGELGGPDLEEVNISINQQGYCVGVPNYDAVAKTVADTIERVLEWIELQRWADTRHILLEGNSVGGLGTVAFAARNRAGVIGYLNFAGGDGGNAKILPGNSCFARDLASQFAVFGRTTRVPNLWLYAENDHFWGPIAPRFWHEAFSAAGGTGEFVETAPLSGSDGHFLLSQGQSLWDNKVTAFLNSTITTAAISR